MNANLQIAFGANKLLRSRLHTVLQIIFSKTAGNRGKFFRCSDAHNNFYVT